MRAVHAFGGDVEIAPKKGYLSLRRGKQFAMIQPSTTSRVDLGLILKDLPAAGRLEPATGFNALFTHRVRLTGVTDVDEQVLDWLRHAYDNAGFSTTGTARPRGLGHARGWSARPRYGR